MPHLKLFLLALSFYTRLPHSSNAGLQAAASGSRLFAVGRLAGWRHLRFSILPG